MGTAVSTLYGFPSPPQIPAITETDTLEEIDPMPGPIPKPDAERQRRNAPTIPTTDVPLAGYTGHVPDPMTPLHTEAARRYYDHAWTSPAAAAWLEVEAEQVAEWANLKAAIDGVYASGGIPQASTLGQLKALADNLYLGPMARAKGRVRVVDNEDGDGAELDLAELGRFAGYEVAD